MLYFYDRYMRVVDEKGMEKYESDSIGCEWDG